MNVSLVAETCKGCVQTRAVKVKVKVHPRTGHEGPEGEWMYCSTLSLTSALDRGGCSKPALAALTAGKTRYPLYRRLGGFQGRSGWKTKISPPPGYDRLTVQLLTSPYADHAMESECNVKDRLNRSFHFSIYLKIIHSPWRWRQDLPRKCCKKYHSATCNNVEHCRLQKGCRERLNTYRDILLRWQMLINSLWGPLRLRMSCYALNTFHSKLRFTKLWR
jgi:hypothetical protein